MLVLFSIALIYQTFLRQNNECTVISIRSAAFINFNENTGYGEIPHRVCEHAFQGSVDLRRDVVNQAVSEKHWIIPEQCGWMVSMVSILYYT